jgi:hypothetical protein
MLIGHVLERTPSVTAAENMSARLADKVRNLWLEHNKSKDQRWEDNFYEDPDGVAFLRGESFPNLQGIDYIFRWWGSDLDDGLAGDLQVLWKVALPEGMTLFKSTIRFAERDFPSVNAKRETQYRDDMRRDFKEAFLLWQSLYEKEVVPLIAP